MATSETEKADVGFLVEGSNLMAINLHKALARSGQNVFFSPFSISSALSMLLHGVRGEAELELRKFLGYEKISNDSLVNAFKSLISTLISCNDGYTVSSANSLVVDKDFDVAEQYKSDLVNFFQALYVEVDFFNESTAAVEQINCWVKEKTSNMVPRLLDSLDCETVMVLLNAVYFKGFWLKQFKEKSTFMQYFYNDGLEDGAKLVEMMHLSESFLWVQKESYKVLQLPYKGEEIAMLVFLPNSRDGLHEVEDMLAADSIAELRKEMRKDKVQVALPKFRIEYSSEDLKGTFQEFGVKQVFQEGADFGGISDRRNLVVSQVVHKAVLEVNEEGCEAAAATAVVIKGRCFHISPEFIVDHPFAFVIFNVQNDLILFMGRVTRL